MTPAELRTFPNADPDTKAQIIAYISDISDPQTRLMFELHFLRGLSYRQTAEMLGGGMSRECVHMRIRRFIRKNKHV
jgi:DNA-directed RNA polymerase specialized sigma24 family protein